MLRTVGELSPASLPGGSVFHKHGRAGYGSLKLLHGMSASLRPPFDGPLSKARLPHVAQACCDQSRPLCCSCETVVMGSRGLGITKRALFNLLAVGSGGLPLFLAVGGH